MNNFLSWMKIIPGKVLAGVGILFGVVAIAVAWGGGLKIQTDVNLKSIEKIGDLCLLKVFDTYIITNEVNGVSGTFVAPCDAILKLDFSKIEISGTNGHYSVSFPPITVSQPRVDREDESFRTFEVSKNVTSLLKSSDPLRRAAMKEAERRIEQEALSGRFIDACDCIAAHAARLGEIVAKHSFYGHEPRPRFVFQVRLGRERSYALGHFGRRAVIFGLSSRHYRCDVGSYAGNPLPALVVDAHHYLGYATVFYETLALGGA